MKRLLFFLSVSASVLLLASCSSNPIPYPDQFPHIEKEDLGPDGFLYQHKLMDQGLLFMIFGVPSTTGINGPGCSFVPQIRVSRDKSLIVLRYRLSYSARDWLFMDRLYLFKDSGLEKDIRFGDVTRKVGTGSPVRISETKYFDFSSLEDIAFMEKYLEGEGQQIYLYGESREHLVFAKGKAVHQQEVIDFYKFLLENPQAR
jgi:hypothetical protein